MNYRKWHDNYIIKVKRETVEGLRPVNKSKSYSSTWKNTAWEFHHVIPKCMGGTNAANNLIPLTLREHFIFHCVLYKLYKGTKYGYKMLCALIRSSKNNVIKTSRLYAQLRKEYAIERSKRLKGKTWEALYGKEAAEERKRKASAFRKTFRYNENAKQKMRESRKSMLKHRTPEEWKKVNTNIRIQKIKNGTNKHSVETRKKMSDAAKANVKHKEECAERLIRWNKDNPPKGGKNGRAIKIKCVETGQLYECIKYAAKEAGVCLTYFKQHLKGQRENLKGLHYVQQTI